MNYAALAGMACIVVGASIFVYAMWPVTAMVRCTFDRNELGPIGGRWQWYWDVYKCEDGTTRRVLVAGPRG